MTTTATGTATAAALMCHGRPMVPEIGFCSGRLFNRCQECRRTDYGWWDTHQPTTEGNQP